jgi:hypothetical protein
MSVTLENLELTPEELEASKEAVRTSAYYGWLNAGCPDGRQLDFWLLAEREWIEHCFVPNRPCDGMRPQEAMPPEAASASVGGGDKSPIEPRRHEEART